MRNRLILLVSLCLLTLPCRAQRFSVGTNAADWMSLGTINAEASVSTPKEYMDEVYEEYLGRRNFLIDGLNKIDGVYAPTPMGAFYVMVRLPVDDAEKFCKWCLTDFQWEGSTIMMAPGAGFYTDPGEGRDQVRMAYILNKEDLAKALIVLEKALKEYNQQTT